ncbi:SDR family oxidoreductase [Paraburkholderia unamae]|uniref:3-oxoacyl-[acyl-carrier protein] reductase n=1 Tax=Paraburkholderia unamae TaxID=219649 RepID=A0ABX5K8D4_9BURK|nr:SDR family oxidoreductase [Paraburkholderia unamae]PVX61104.1 3-oxoacyl-[acyl-carrier protein] reductase [Paraburkholderia unamae]RAR51709.1 3-oxoacyl-[acyl-carrier protein] reductase [Paraburkholderia unamae]
MNASTQSAQSTPSRGVAIVTGASRGIGAALAARLARDGYAVVVNYASSSAEAEALVAKIEAAGGRAIAVKANIAKADEVRRLFDTTRERLGQPTVLVNNAGIMKTITIAESTDALYDETFDINVRGTLNTLREAATKLADGGRVINFSTSALAMNLPGYGLYTASKAAVEAITRVFARELRGRSICVNAVAPGPVATELFLKGKTDEQVKHFASMPPLQRLGEPEDIAGLVSFLAGPDGGWVNGQVLRANGGIV